MFTLHFYQKKIPICPPCNMVECTYIGKIFQCSGPPETLNRGVYIYIHTYTHIYIYIYIYIYIGGWGGECSQHSRQPRNRFVSFVRACVRSSAIGECCWHRGGLKLTRVPRSLFPFLPSTSSLSLLKILIML